MFTNTMGYSVGQVASLANTTVRTLHHYDAIRLLCPTTRTEGGQRIYSDADIERLQRILYYREIGLALDEIAQHLDHEGDTALTHLHRSHQLLTAKLQRTTALIAAIEHEMEALAVGYEPTPEERLEVFSSFDASDFTEETVEPWRVATARPPHYTSAEWEEIKANSAQLINRFIGAMQSGVPAESELVMDLAEEQRLQIARWFYPCPYDIHLGLADLYVSDAGFRAHFEKISPGLSQYISDAIQANAVRHSSSAA